MISMRGPNDAPTKASRPGGAPLSTRTRAEWNSTRPGTFATRAWIAWSCHVTTSSTGSGPARPGTSSRIWPGVVPKPAPRTTISPPAVIRPSPAFGTVSTYQSPGPESTRSTGFATAIAAGASRRSTRCAFGETEGSRSSGTRATITSSCQAASHDPNAGSSSTDRLGAV